MRKLVLVFAALILAIAFVGCGNIKNEVTGKTELVYESLSEKEDYLMNLTGNKILTYKLKNIPNDKKYEILLTYEVYENNEKVKEDTILGMIQDEISEKVTNEKIGINFQDSKIRYLLGENGAYATGQYEIKEDLSKYSQAYLINNAKLEIGREIYIYYATSGESIRTNIPLGVAIDTRITNKILEDSKSTVLIKLSFKEKS